MLRRIGLRASDLDGLALGYLDAWARCAAKVELLDRHIEKHGLVNAEGEVPGFMSLYVSLINSARLSLAKLDDRLKDRPADDGIGALIAEGRLIRERRAALDAVEPLAIVEGDGS